MLRPFRGGSCVGDSGTRARARQHLSSTQRSSAWRVVFGNLAARMQPISAGRAACTLALGSNSGSSSGPVSSAPAEASPSCVKVPPATAPEAVVEVVQQPKVAEEEEYSEVYVTTEMEPEAAVRQPLSLPTPAAAGRTALGAALVLLLSTLAIAVKRTYDKVNNAKAKRLRQVQQNKKLVTELGKFLPGQRANLDSGIIESVKQSTGFSSGEVFRKYLWFLLRERSFDQAAVDDLVALKAAAGLTDADVAEALRERAQRVHDKYGTLALHPDRFPGSSVQGGSTCRELFRKLLFLAECDALVRRGSEAAGRPRLREIFAATEEDLDRLRIVSLYDVDLEKAFSKPTEQASDDEDD